MAETTPARSRRGAVWFVLALLVVAGIVILVRRASHAAVPVRVAQAVDGDLTSTVSTNGVTEPVNDFEAHSPLAAVVRKVTVREGDRVARGQLLLTLDDASAVADMARAVAAVKSAQAELSAVEHGGTQDERLVLGGQVSAQRANRDAAQRNLDTLKQLEATGAASPAEVAAAEQRLSAATASLSVDQTRQTQRYASVDVQKARAALVDAQAQYSAAAQTISQANVRAPFAGTVYSLPVHATDFVSVGEKLLAMADLSRVRVRAYFDEPEIGKLKTGQTATFVWAAHPDRTWHGHVGEMPSSIIHYGTRNVGQVLLNVDETDGSLLPSTNVTVTVTTFSSRNVLTIPREALHLDGKGNYVFVLQGDHARRRDITLGALNMVQAQVLSGLNNGDTVVLGAVSGVPIENNMRVQLSD